LSPEHAAIWLQALREHSLKNGVNTQKVIEQDLVRTLEQAIRERTTILIEGE
jgi:hypothetical protein